MEIATQSQRIVNHGITTGSTGSPIDPAPGEPRRSISKMKKRIRKKKHHGEFTEWGRRLVVTRNRKDGFDEFLDAFIAQAIEANGCFCGGGGKEDRLDVIVELGRRSDDPAARMKRITAWLDARPDVLSWRTGELFDIWHGDFRDIGDKIEQAPAPDRQ